MNPEGVEVTLPNGLKYTQPTGLFINGKYVKSKSGKKFATINPATEDVITEVYEALEEDVDAAVEAAQKAFDESGWATEDPSSRAEVLYKFAEVIDKNKELLAAIDTADNGKAIVLSRGDVELAIKCMKVAASYADKVMGNVVETGDSHFSFTRKEPLGVCGQIIPWNFPIVMWVWKVGPALACGNAVVLKTAESTPLTGLLLAKFAQEAGVPDGILNVLSGFGQPCGNAITLHPKIKKVAFTGSTATGRIIMQNAAKSNLKKVTLELGGKSPNIVFDDCDLESTVKNLVLGIFFNSGEVCSAGSRIYIQEGIYDKMLKALKSTTEQMVKIGDPYDEKTFQGAQTSQMQLDKVLKYIADGKKDGAKVLMGGERFGTKGYFIKPTIFTDVKENMKIVKEEIFGPVVTVSKFKTVDEVVKLANDTEYGLAAGLHTENVNTAIQVARKLKAGTVWVNTYNDFHPLVPFGGYNQSGIGRELGIEVFENYLQVKAIRLALKK